jgi:hypothetical protein
MHHGDVTVLNLLKADVAPKVIVDNGLTAAAAAELVDHLAAPGEAIAELAAKRSRPLGTIGCRPIERCRNRSSSCICCPPKWAGIEMAIPIGRLDIGVSQQAADHCQPHADRSTVAREGMAKIMKPDSLKPGCTRHHRPRALEV